VGGRPHLRRHPQRTAAVRRGGNDRRHRRVTGSLRRQGATGHGRGRSSTRSRPATSWSARSPRRCGRSFSPGSAPW
jgi:hypothetical protein